MAVSSTGFFKYLATNSTGMTALTDSVTTTKPSNLIKMGPFRGIKLILFGTDADGETMTCKVQAIRRIGPFTDTETTFTQGLTEQWSILTHTVLTGTFGPLVGASGGYIANTDFICDIISQAITTYGTATEAAFQAPAAINTTAASNNLVNSYYLPDVGDVTHIRLELDNGTGVDANCLVSLFT